jgi:putative DNA primase/helicase
VYTVLEHGGDFAAAASALAREGYGAPPAADAGVDLSQFMTGSKPQLAKIQSSRAKVETPPPIARAIVRRLSDVVRQPLEWLWPGRIPLGKLSLLAGDPGLGKSFVSIDLAARVTRGDCWPDNPFLRQTPGGVILFNSEDDLQDTIAPRLDATGADDSRIVSVEGVELISGDKTDKYERTFSLEIDLPRLEEVLDDCPDTRLVVIDPISAYCGQVDTHKNADVRALLAPLALLASKRRVAILAITHLTKSGGTKAVYRAMGSLAFAAAARAVWAILKDPEQPQRRWVLPAKMNLAQDLDGLAYRLREGRVAWETDPVRMHADDAFVAEAAEADRRSKAPRPTVQQSASDWLLTAVTATPVLSSEILERGDQAGFSKRSLQRAFRELGGEPQKAGFDGGWLWALPAGLTDTAA